MKISINRDEGTPIYRQIVRQIREMILSRQLPAGFRLPPERRLAEALGVTRATIVTAYDELKSEGLIDARVGRGTVVLSAKNPDPSVDGSRQLTWSHHFRDEGARQPDPLVRNLLEMSMRPGVISLAVGLPSPHHVPAQLFQQLIQRVMQEGGAHALLQTPTEGHPSLREAMARWLTTRGMHCSPDEVMMLSGSQQGLQLTARVLLSPGDTVIVEAPTYFGAMEAFRKAGARMVSVPVDVDGMQVDVLSALLRHHRPKLIYTLPTFQNPSGVVMSLERRRQLLALAAGYGIPVLEEDTYAELRYDGAVVPSLKAMDTTGVVLNLGTFSKILFPGLRLGWMIAPRQVIRRIALSKQTEDLHSSTLGQWAMERMITEGHLETHLVTLRHVYRQQRDVMGNALDAGRIDGMNWDVPLGGFYFWCELPRTVDRARLSAMAAELAVNFLPGYPCFVDEPSSHWVRLNFTFPAPQEIEEGVSRFLRAVQGAIAPRQQEWDRRQAGTRPIV
jgi:DNA-binding transcriptional MocR family regulator